MYLFGTPSRPRTKLTEGGKGLQMETLNRVILKKLYVQSLCEYVTYGQKNYKEKSQLAYLRMCVFTPMLKNSLYSVSAQKKGNVKSVPNTELCGQLKTGAP